MNDTDLALLREWLSEPNSEEWNDDRLNAMYEACDRDLHRTAAAFWRVKANEAASLVDVTENGSSRKLSDLHKNYLDIAGYHESQAAVPAETEIVGRPRIRQIVRP